MDVRKAVVWAACSFMAATLPAQYRITGLIAGHEGRVLLLAPSLSGTCDTLGNVVSVHGAFCFEGKTDQLTLTEIQAVDTRVKIPLFLEDGTFQVEADTERPARYRVSGGGEAQRLRNEFRAEEWLFEDKRDSLRAVLRSIRNPKETTREVPEEGHAWGAKGGHAWGTKGGHAWGTKGGHAWGTKRGHAWGTKGGHAWGPKGSHAWGPEEGHAWGPEAELGQRLQAEDMLRQTERLYEEAEEKFIREHDHFVSAGLLAERLPTLARSRKIAGKYRLLGKIARNTLPGRLIKPYADKAACLVKGGTAPDMRMLTPDGDSLSIYGMKAKVKILDFWASWCGPCRAESPTLRRLYSRYKATGLEIVSISLDTKKESWLTAIEKDGLPWTHLSDLKGWNSLASDIYEVHAIPHLFVLDRNNRIIAEGLRGEELEACVREALEN